MNVRPTSDFEMLLPADVALETAISIEHASFLSCRAAGNTEGASEASAEEGRLIADRIIWQHYCPFVGSPISERDSGFVECRCFEGPRFLAAQDAIAVRLDLERGAAE